MPRKYPNPILDSRERALLIDLQTEFEKFTKPSPVKQGISYLQKLLGQIIPDKFKVEIANAGDAALELEWIKRALEFAEKGFQTLQEQTARLTISKQAVLIKLVKRGAKISEFNEICLVRSYDIEAVVEAQTYQNYLLAFSEGVATGAPGLVGIPFNLVLSFFIFFRATQSIALYYGYDVKEDPRELQIAAEVTMQSLAKNFKGGGLQGMLGKMMLAANLTSLGKSLGTRTYTEMARRGGSELLYVKIRALANRAAAKALEKTGQEGIEAGIFKALLEEVAKQLPKRAGKNAIPFLSALFVALTDTALMRRVLRGTKLIYHKRFLLEKEHRIAVLKGTRAQRRRSHGKSRGGTRMRAGTHREIASQDGNVGGLRERT